MSGHERSEGCLGREGLMGRPIEPESVEDMRHPETVMNNMLAFGSAYVRRVWGVLDRAIGAGVPMVLAAAGPITVSGAHLYYINSLLRTGWFAAVSTTDAVCYHDGHRSLSASDLAPVREVAIDGRDLEHHDADIIRVTNTGFPGQVLYEQDKFLTTMLLRREFQCKMSGTEFRYRLGRYYQVQEQAVGAKPGLLATCYEHGIPVFVGAPGDGSVFLNAMKLWAMQRAGLLQEFAFELDIHREVFESCAMHYELTSRLDPKQIGIWILGGGVPKNFALQPEPGLRQILGVQAPGYLYDAQIVGADVKDGSLSSCPPEEAYTWDKIDRKALTGDADTEPTVATLQADYTMIAPFMAQALLGKRKRFEALAEQLGDDDLFRRHPEARGYLNRGGQRRLYDRLPEMTERLLTELRTNRDARDFLASTLKFPLPDMREE